MTSEPRRDPLTDQLITPQNSALILIDYQPIQVRSVQSMNQSLMVDNVVRVTKTALAFGVPIIVSTVNVKTGRNKPMIPELQALLPGVEPIDRTSVNSWEDVEFVAAVRATGRNKLVIAALWTEVCLTFPALDAMREGFEVYPMVDAVGGTSVEAHRAGLERMIQAGAQPTSWAQFTCELQRDWARKETVKAFTEILFDPNVPFVAAERMAGASA